MRVLLVSTYELGHQPLHVASPAGALRRRGHDVRCVDLAVDDWDPAVVDDVDAVAVSVPMHTATRLALDVAASVAGRVPTCAYGLYAPAAAGGFDRAIAGEYEPALLEWVDGQGSGLTVHLQRGAFGLPARDLLPPLDRYAKLAIGGEERVVEVEDLVADEPIEATRTYRHGPTEPLDEVTGQGDSHLWQTVQCSATSANSSQWRIEMPRRVCSS